MRILTCLLGAAVAAGTPVLASPAHADGWRWPLPAEPVVVRGFDPPPQNWSAGHRGVDLRARAGVSVLAAGDGIISYAGLLAGRGVVVVQHADGRRTTYEPLEPTLTVGDRVETGQRIGRLTTDGSHCAPVACLHWGLRRGETYLDPLQLVGRGPVRLLPVFGTSLGAPAPPVAARFTDRATTQPREPGSPWSALGGAAAAGVITAASATRLARRRRPRR